MGGGFLESQGKSKGAFRLLKRPGISDKRIVFIPLQVQRDSVILHFTREPFKFEVFLELIDDIAWGLGKGIAFVAKKHPLALGIHKKAYKNIIFAPDDTNLLDLLAICECVLTLNSGIGVYAMMAGKSCIVCGEAFYRFDGLNLQATDKESLIHHLRAVLEGQFIFDEEKSLRFLYYLCFKFYSFGTII